MKRKKLKAGVANELFFNYFVSYLVLIIIMIIIFVITFGVYIGYLFMPSSIKYEELNKKLLSDYWTISDDDLKDINGFVVTIDENNDLLYKKGNIIEEFNEITVDDYVKIFNPDEYNGTLTLPIMKMFESTLALGDMQNSIIKAQSGKEYSISYRYIKNDKLLLIFGVPYENINKYNKYNHVTGNKKQILILLSINFAIVLILLYLFAKFTARKFIKPISILNLGMKKIAEGNYGEKVVVKNKNEFGSLAEGFNLMSEAIQTEKLENERLQQERNKLILHISHDLKNPLAAVLGYSEVLSNDKNLSEEEKNEYLSIINKNSKRANKIITDLFEFSLLDSLDYKMNIKTVDINEVLREIVADYIPELESREFIYEFEISEEKNMTQIDDVKFTRAISNLIDNSIKYNEKGTTLTVIAKNINNKTEITIADDGKGINKEVKDKIFDAFVREDKARRSTTGGTGLGLAITKAIIEKHNGTIELMSTNKGTEYKIII